MIQKHSHLVHLLHLKIEHVTAKCPPPNARKNSGSRWLLTLKLTVARYLLTNDLPQTVSSRPNVRDPVPQDRVSQSLLIAFQNRLRDNCGLSVNSDFHIPGFDLQITAGFSVI